MNDSKIRDVVKLGDIKTIKKELVRSIFMIIFFGGILLAINYAKTHSIAFLSSMIFLVLSMLIYGLITVRKIKKDKRVFFIFESISLLITSNIFLAMSLTSYYVYLGFNNVLFGCILFFINFFVAFVVYKDCRKIIIKSTKMNKGKLVGRSLGAVVSIGYLLGWSLSKKMGQVEIHVAIIVIAYIVSCVALIASAINFLKYKLASKMDVR